MRILYVEDSEQLRRSVAEGLRQFGFAVDTSGDGEEGLHLARGEAYDVIVLDVILPKLDGLELLRRLREVGNSTRVLVLTARDTVPDKVAGLRAGADDYLVKPFAFEEFVARVQALARRQNNLCEPRIRIGTLEIDLSEKCVRRDGMVIPLPPREYSVLEFLASRKGKVVSRMEIESHMYDMHSDVMSNVVDSAVCSIRRRLDSREGPSLIQTRRGFGYMLVDPTA
jgi:DNA-binding response OmpR family regulator